MVPGDDLRPNHAVMRANHRENANVVVAVILQSIQQAIQMRPRIAVRHAATNHNQIRSADQAVRLIEPLFMVAVSRQPAEIRQRVTSRLPADSGPRTKNARLPIADISYRAMDELP